MDFLTTLMLHKNMCTVFKMINEQQLTAEDLKCITINLINLIYNYLTTEPRLIFYIENCVTLISCSLRS